MSILKAILTFLLSRPGESCILEVPAWERMRPHDPEVLFQSWKNRFLAHHPDLTVEDLLKIEEKGNEIKKEWKMHMRPSTQIVKVSEVRHTPALQIVGSTRRGDIPRSNKHDSQEKSESFDSSARCRRGR